MATYVAFRDGGRTDEIGISRSASKLWSGNIIEGMRVEATTSPSMNVIITPGDIKINHDDSAFFGWSDSPMELPISTADITNPRIDRVIAYIDTTAVPDSNLPNNPGLLQFSIISGVPATTPEAPSDIAVQATVGVNNPWCELARLTIPASASQIVDSDITDTRSPVTLTPKVVSENLALSVHTASSWHTYNLGTITLYSRQFTFSGGGNLGSGSNRAIGNINYPPGQTASTVRRIWSSRMSSNAPFFNTVVETNTVRILNAAGTTVAPGTVTMDVLCITT